MPWTEAPTETVSPMRSRRMSFSTVTTGCWKTLSWKGTDRPLAPVASAPRIWRFGYEAIAVGVPLMRPVFGSRVTQLGGAESELQLQLGAPMLLSNVGGEERKANPTRAV